MDRRIERATDEDRNAMAALHEACGLSPRAILAPDPLCWVCRTERGVAGTCGPPGSIGRLSEEREPQA